MNRIFGAAGLVLITAAAAQAHVTLSQPEARVGGSYKAVFRIGHGCDGKPTTLIKVKLPEGVINAEPVAKPGWRIEEVKGPYAKTYAFDGGEVSEGVKEIAWTGGQLADGKHDEFAVTVFLTSDLPAGETLYFPLVQECPDGAAERWIEIPDDGQSAHDLEYPAPGLKLLPRKQK